MILLPIFVSVTNKTKFMPEICRFFGIIIFLYWKDHNPPHIHFTYVIMNVLLAYWIGL